MGRIDFEVTQPALFDTTAEPERCVGNVRIPHPPSLARLESHRIRDLLRMAMELGAASFGGPLSDLEALILERIVFYPPPSRDHVESIRQLIRAGGDPLGDELCEAWSATERRSAGAFYTQPAIVRPMVEWAIARSPRRLVDPGCGSGRFAAAAFRQDPRLEIVAIDLDPVATILTRATMAALGVHSVTVLQADYTHLELQQIEGCTAFVGNPPYVRHHDLTPSAKNWIVRASKILGHRTSALAGLHAHFFVATALIARPGDIGCFVTSAEWLDVNYGSIVRDLLLNGLGGCSVHVIDPRTAPFTDAMTTAAITTFEVGVTPSALRLQYVERVSHLQSLEEGKPVPRSSLEPATRWSPLLRESTSSSALHEFVPLRTIARVHRGVVTGANGFFVLTRQRAKELGLQRWCRPTITSAKELFAANGVIRDLPERRLLLDVPADVDRSAFPELDMYLRRGESSQGDKPAVADGYIASRRRPWWSLSLPPPPPIIASYMARQAPVFALNPDGLAVINIAHGVYPSLALTSGQLSSLVTILNAARESFRGSGRTYHGGLEKFEPREMESLLIPSDLLESLTDEP